MIGHRSESGTVGSLGKKSLFLPLLREASPDARNVQFLIHFSTQIRAFFVHVLEKITCNKIKIFSGLSSFFINYCLKWLMRVSRPNTMKFVYKDSFRHSNLKSNMTGIRILNVTEKIFVKKFQYCKVDFVH